MNRYSSLKRQYSQVGDEQRLISYAFRCFYVGDEEEYQLVGVEDSIQQEYIDAIRTIGNPKADKCLDAIELFYAGGNGHNGQEVADMLIGHIWNHHLFVADKELWFSVIFDEQYEKQEIQ